MTQRRMDINDLHVEINGKEILKGISLAVCAGEVHAIMGPNGSGKSTLASTLMGHPKYNVTSGKIVVDGEDITKLPPNERAKRGLFLSFQYPSEISGVTVSNFLRTAYNAVTGKKIPVVDFHKMLKEKMAQLKMDSSFSKRYLNEGFSGGEKKRTEILQMMVLQPAFAILDETDSGLDVDALRIVAQGINAMRLPGRAIVLITHYRRILDYVVPDKIHILQDGKIIRSGGKELAAEIEERGYELPVEA
ncbi:Fe-S cluster assembly ATPase SufC [Candidatus Woesearchaeota archaeon]|nr:Fe-S cluster assembly ATPase SufC [Candidatus Woesearchaeota archaeon]